MSKFRYDKNIEQLLWNKKYAVFSNSSCSIVNTCLWQEKEIPKVKGLIYLLESACNQEAIMLSEDKVGKIVFYSFLCASAQYLFSADFSILFLTRFLYILLFHINLVPPLYMIYIQVEIYVLTT